MSKSISKLIRVRYLEDTESLTINFGNEWSRVP